jgi:hypothetical protein
MGYTSLKYPIKMSCYMKRQSIDELGLNKTQKGKKDYLGYYCKDIEKLLIKVLRNYPYIRNICFENI